MAATRSSSPATTRPRSDAQDALSGVQSRLQGRVRQARSRPRRLGQVHQRESRSSGVAARAGARRPRPPRSPGVDAVDQHRHHRGHRPAQRAEVVAALQHHAPAARPRRPPPAAATPPSPRTRPRTRGRSPAGRRGARRSRREISTSSGSHERISAARHVLDQGAVDRVPAPARHRQVHRVARARRRTRRRTPARSPDTAGTRGSTRTARRRPRGRCRWCRCRGGRPSRRSSPATGRGPTVARRAATATLPKKQNPIARAASAWWPGGRSALTPTSRPRRPAARRRAAPRRPRPQRGSIRPRHGERVGVDRAAARLATATSTKATCDAGWTAPGRRAGPRPPTRAPRRTSRARSSRPRAPGSAPDARDDRARRGRRCRRGAARARGVRSPPSPHRNTVSARAIRPRRRRRRRGRALRRADRCPRGRAQSRSSRARPLAETASYWAQGGAAAALAVDDTPALHLEDTLTAGRGLTRRAAAEVLTDESPARVKELIDLGVQFDADRHGDLALGLEGGHSRRRIIHAGGSATGRRILRGLSARVVEHPRIEVLEGTRAAAILEAGGVRLTDGEDLTARATILATGGAAALYVAHDQPARLVRLRPAARPPRRRDARRPRVHPVPPHGGHRAPRQGGLPDLRGRPRRGRDAARPHRRALRERARPARRRRPRDLRHARAHARHLGRPRHDDGRPRPLPQHRRCAAGGGPGPDDAADPRRARQPLRDGRDRHRPRRARDRRRAPLRGRRVRLHGPARREPARLELAQRMLRLRPPRGAEGARRPRARASPSRTPAIRSKRRAARPARPSGRSPAWSAPRRT